MPDSNSMLFSNRKEKYLLQITNRVNLMDERKEFYHRLWNSKISKSI